MRRDRSSRRVPGPVAQCVPDAPQLRFGAPGASGSLALTTVAGLIALVCPAACGSGAPVSLVLSGGGPVALGESTSFSATATAAAGVARTVRFELQAADGRVQSVTRWPLRPESGRAQTMPVHSFATAQWFEQTGEFRLRGTIDGVRVGNELLIQVGPPGLRVPRFADATAESGISTRLPQDDNTTHAAGAAWGDADGDGDPDLYIPRRDGPAHLWINGAGTFTEQAAARGVENAGARGVGAVFADYDNDGDEDLYVVNDALDTLTAAATGTGDRLYRNDGAGRFTDVSDSALGAARPRDNGAAAAWGDFDRDGWLDLFVVTGNAFNNGHKPPGRPMSLMQPDVLLRNRRDGTFTDQTCALPASTVADAPPGFCGTNGSGFQAIWIDFDGDLDLDLFVGQDNYKALLHRDTNRLYRNEGADQATGRWRFSDVSGGEEGIAGDMNTMGVAAGDADGDLILDLALTNTGSHGGNSLWLGAGADGFRRAPAEWGVSRIDQDAESRTTTWGLLFADFNLDGRDDLFVAAGDTYNEPNEPDMLFVNDGNRRFLDLSAPSGVTDPGVGHGAFTADWNRDGRPDLFVVNANGPVRLYRNTTPVENLHWLGVRLVGRPSPRDPCGAGVVVTTPAGSQLKGLFCGSSEAGGNDRELLFGLGEEREAALEVRWPSGRVERIANLPGVDRRCVVREGAGRCDRESDS